jgi:hypothetical protein
MLSGISRSRVLHLLYVLTSDRWSLCLVSGFYSSHNQTPFLFPVFAISWFRSNWLAWWILFKFMPALFSPALYLVDRTLSTVSLHVWSLIRWMILFFSSSTFITETISNWLSICRERKNKYAIYWKCITNHFDVVPNIHFWSVSHT